MGMLSRMFNVIRSNINSWLDKAEDPEKMLTQMIADLENQKRQAKEQVAYTLADQKRLERSLVQEKEESQKWEQKAVLAIQNNRDELAKEALIRKKEHERRGMEFEKQLEVHAKNTTILKESYQKLEDKIDEIKRKKGLIIAKQRQAEAQTKIYQTVEGLNTDGAGALETIERMEEKVDALQDRSAAYQELSLDSGKDSLEKQFRALEQGPSSDIDRELLELKQRAGLIEHKSEPTS